MTNRIQLPRDTEANWTRVNPILEDGEPGLNIDNNQIKYGDGVTYWNDLAYPSDRLINGTHQATLDSNGILNVPTEIMDLLGNNHVNLNDNGGIAIGTAGTNPVSIYTDDNGAYNSWWFSEKGFLSLPDCGSGPPTSPPDNGPAFAQHDGVLYWYNGSTWKTVNLT